MLSMSLNEYTVTDVEPVADAEPDTVGPFLKLDRKPDITGILDHLSKLE
jgi:hypothetical protein